MLTWRSRGRRRGPVHRDGAIVQRPIPKWLLSDVRFLKALDSWFEEWWPTRPAGFAGIDEFTKNIYEFATGFMRRNVIQAVTPDHKLDVCLSVLRLLLGERLDEIRLSRLLSIDPELKTIVIVDVDLEEPGRNTVSQDVLDLLYARSRALAREAIAARADDRLSSSATEPSSGVLRNHKPDSVMIQRLKALKQGRRLSVEQVWDDEAQEYATDLDEVANVFMRALRDRQGSRRGHPTAGQQLLDNWQADFSTCRERLTLNEIEVIIRDGPTGKRPGPDGVPGELYRRYAGQLALVFQEAWESSWVTVSRTRCTGRSH